MVKQRGFEEAQRPFDAGPPASASGGPASGGANPGGPAGRGGRLKVGPGGRVLIPADMRAALGVVEGDVLFASLADGELRLMAAPTAVRRAQALLRGHVPAGTASLADDLIADRRREALEAREAKEE